MTDSTLTVGEGWEGWAGGHESYVAGIEVGWFVYVGAGYVHSLRCCEACVSC